MSATIYNTLPCPVGVSVSYEAKGRAETKSRGVKTIFFKCGIQTIDEKDFNLIKNANAYKEYIKSGAFIVNDFKKFAEFGKSKKQAEMSPNDKTMSLKMQKLEKENSELLHKMQQLEASILELTNEKK